MLKALPCFKRPSEITLISEGRNNNAYKVVDEKGTYFAKYIAQDENLQQVHFHQIAAEKNYAPQVLFHDNKWLITNYIDSTSLQLLLSKQDIPYANAITLTIKMMINCHTTSLVSEYVYTRLPVEDCLPKIDSFNGINTKERIKLRKIICELIVDKNELRDVFTHGDLNFTNIIIENNTAKGYAYLTDFECSYVAEPEFDMGMFFAINNIYPEKYRDLIKSYNELKPELVTLNEILVMRYLVFSLFINSLWFYEKSLILEGDTNNLELQKLADEQIHLLKLTLSTTFKSY